MGNCKSCEKEARQLATIPTNLRYAREQERFQVKKTKDRNVWLHGNIAIPQAVEDVQAATSLLAQEFPQKPFIVICRRAIHKSLHPILDLSQLTTIKEIQGGLVLDAGVTICQLVQKLEDLKVTLSPFPTVSALSYDGGQTVIGALNLKQSSSPSKLLNAVSKIQCMTSQEPQGKTYYPPFTDFPKGSIIMTTTLKTSSVCPCSDDKPMARWYSRNDLSPPIDHLLGLPDSANVMIFKVGKSAKQRLAICIEGPEILQLEEGTDVHWKVEEVLTHLELWKQKCKMFHTLGFDHLTKKHTVSIPAGSQPDIHELQSKVQQMSGQMLLEIQGQEIIVSSYEDINENDLQFIGGSVIKTQIVDNSPTSFSFFASPVERQLLEDFGTSIPDFSGEVYDHLSPLFIHKSDQYATSSTDNKLMKPAIIAYPKNEDDIVAAIKYAKCPLSTKARPNTDPLKVIARSGGHHYGGASCGSGAIILSMDHFQTLEVNTVDKKFKRPDGDGWTHVTKEAKVGVGNRLEAIAKKFNSEEVTIPHGECPTVGIGGHIQTGGIGHLLRSFGLCLDYLYSFRIVLADESILEVSRDATEKDDIDLFWAVCGGCPGAFGVVTMLVFHPILDADYPTSTAYQTSCLYSSKMAKVCVGILQEFANNCRKDDPDPIPDIDMMITLETYEDIPFIFYQPSLILFELVCKEKTDKHNNPTPAYKKFEEFKKKFEDSMVSSLGDYIAKWALSAFGWISLDGKRHIPLSEISLAFIRKAPAVVGKTADQYKGAREYSLPYTKVTCAATDALPENFAGAFSELIDKVKNEKQLRLLWQCAVWGGSFARKGISSSIAHRDDLRISISFDLFRQNLPEAIKTAQRYQDMFLDDIVNKFMAHKPKIMFQWAPHGNTDMNNREVWERYFQNEDDYNRLRFIKNSVDSENLFCSRFSISPSR